MPSRTSGSSVWRAAAWVGVAVVAAGCGSVQPPRFHSLMPASASSAKAFSEAGPLAWEVLPVGIPQGVDQPQWVVRRADGSLAVLEQERWIAPLAEELRAAITERLTQMLGAPLTESGGEMQRRWRIKVDVQRFESSPGVEARLEALWSVRAVSGEAASLSCRVEIAQSPGADGYLGLANAHRQGVRKLGDAIGSALKALSSGQQGVCSG